MDLRLGSRTLGESPTVIVAVRDTVAPQELRDALEHGAHAIEFRVDQFADFAVDFVSSNILERRLGPSLVTIRHEREGGGWTRSEAERLELYRALLPFTDGVDCELESGEICSDVFHAARTADKLTIGSYHDFEHCVPEEKLESLIALGDERGADIVKVAAYCRDNDELRRLAAFTLRHAERGVIVIGMGPAGTPTRVLFPALGSLLTYTFPGEPAAPGQLNCVTLVEYLSALYL